jgi:hypothetical protein
MVATALARVGPLGTKLQGARYEGREIAEIAKKLLG